MKNIFFIVIIVFTAYNSYSQTSLNDYKYVIVPEQFHFQTEPNQYRLNDLIKFMFKKVGFESFIEGDPIPDDLKNNYCLALRAEVKSKGVFSTKSTITLLDCNKEEIFVTREGISKEKEFSKTYNLSLRDAFKSFEGFEYNFNPNSKYKNLVNEKEEVAKLKEEIKELKEEKRKLEQPVKVAEIKNENLPEVKKENFLMVKSIKNGFKIINNQTRDLEFIIYKTDIKNVFLIENNKGIVYRKNNSWYKQSIKEGDTTTSKLDLRF